MLLQTSMAVFSSSTSEPVSSFKPSQFLSRPPHLSHFASSPSPSPTITATATIASGTLLLLLPRNSTIPSSLAAPLVTLTRPTPLAGFIFFRQLIYYPFSCFYMKDDDSPVHGLSKKIVGVLGGGQLGRMLCQAASKMAIKVMVLDPSENCPASALAYDHMVRSFDDSATVKEFAKRCGVLTVEIEHVDVATLEKLEQQGIDCEPKASTIRIIQVNSLGLFTCERINISRKFIFLGMAFHFLSLWRFAFCFLFYREQEVSLDGRGNAVAKSEGELSSAIDVLGGFGHGLYVEKWAPFIKELAVIVARGRDNSILCYPVVETIHK
ncbi:hypothetical protein Goari_014812 [Gossypium aridum]|uniref:Uncharacterized protein n=1 Tax=Gossypium aridum TaxID=34290 RepID=A0A7J8XJ97_GOSAI|nr:hypothetical protein [Gossypium aridum]